MTYRAIIEVNGKRAIVFPRARGTSLFRSIQAAERRLEEHARRLTVDSRGYVETPDGTVVRYLAL